MVLGQYNSYEEQVENQFFNTTPTVKITSIKSNEISLKNTFTHTVFGEFQALTTCPNCPYAADALHNIYTSNDSQFYYVSLINDMNPNAKNRINNDYICNLRKWKSFPTVYFDGGEKNMVGRLNSVNATEGAYRTLLDEVGNRNIPVPIELSSEIVWGGDGKLNVSVTVINKGNKSYLGMVQSYVTEIVSRWKDSEHNPFNFGFLDFAIKTSISISAGETKTITEQWDASQAHGQNFGEISKNNIIVISTVSHWIPHFQTGYKNVEVLYLQIYFAHYVDQTTAATPVLQ